MFYLTTATTEAVLRNCTQLEELKLRNCDELTRLVSPASSLVELSTSSVTDGEKENEKEKEQEKEKEKEKEKQEIDWVSSVTSLDVTGCKGLQTSGWADLFPHLPQLRHLYLPINVSARDALELLPSFCPLLETLSLDSIPVVTDSLIGHLAHNLPSLTSLSVSNCTKLTGSSMTYLIWGTGNILFFFKWKF